ncbi:MAG: hypothetical protein WBZ19_21600, partial [Chthoniobacterales bacterium]
MDLNSVNDNADSAGSGAMGEAIWWGEAPERPCGLGGEIKLAATFCGSLAPPKKARGRMGETGITPLTGRARVLARREDISDLWT